MHKAVLLKETIEGMSPRSGGTYIDGTLGGGGHAEALLEASSPDSRLLGLDRDPDAIERCNSRLLRFGKRFTCVHSDFASMKAVALANGFENVDGIMLDLGVSSFQLDEPERGFSFMSEGPLDMRMDTTRGMTAAEFLASFGDDWRSLAKVLREFGEEPQSAAIAKAIIAEQLKTPTTTTKKLAEVIEKAVGGRRGAPRHPATRSFQALRIAVNRESDQLRDGLEAAIELLAIEGRLVVISFHSLEDRIVKHTFAAHEGRMASLQQGGAKWEGVLPAVARVTKRPAVPSEQEISDNPRARSAKLRIVRRVQNPR